VFPACIVSLRQMEGENGWEDVGLASEQGKSQGGQAAASGQMGSTGEIGGIMSDAMTGAMVRHFARELGKDSLSLWPQFLQSTRQYFNVNHGYVLRKVAWQLAPVTNPKKKSVEGELGGEKDWASRVFEGLEVDIEEPDLYIPTMGLVTYVLLCGVISGLQDQFSPEVLSATVSFTLVLLVIETTIAKGALYMAGAVQAPVFDLIALLGYKYFYLSLQLAMGLIFGVGLLYNIVALGLTASCVVALFQALRRLARMQPTQAQEAVKDLHPMVLKALPVLQLLVVWCLLPSWPQRPSGKAGASSAQAAVALEAVAKAASSLTTTVAAKAAAAAAAAAADVPAHGNASG
jgi:hypothetical protein